MSSKPEQLMWGRLKATLETYAFVQRHEDRFSPDVPDVSFVRKSDGLCGWVEMKTIDRWSKGVTRLPHLRPGQVNWLVSRGATGASVWLLLWVREGNEWLWIPGKDLAHSMIDVGQARGDWLALSQAGPC